MAASLTLRVVSAPPTERAPPPFTLAGGRATIGRRDGNSWVLPDASAGVSREHAVIEGAQGGWQIVDKSANGTFVNGQNVGNGNAWPLGPGDSIRIGGYEIAVEMEGGQDDFGRAAAGPPTIGNDSFDLGDLARADFGAPRAAPRGPSPLDPMAEERPPELPASNDLFGELGDNRTPLSPGGTMADPFNAPEQRGLGAPPPDASPFGAPSPSSGSPFGGPMPDNWGTPQAGNPDPFAAPAPPPQRSAFTNAPDPLAALPDPFDQPPAAPDDRHVPMPQSPFALQPVAIPNPVGPGPQQALPTDWDATPSGGLSAPPAELDPIEAALAGLAPKTGSSQPVAPDPGLDRAFGMPPGPVPGPTPPQPAAARPRPQAPTPRPAPPPPAPPQHRPPVPSPAPAPRAMAPVAPPVDDWVDVPQAPPVGDNLFGDANAGQPAPGPANAMQSPPIPTDDPFDGPSDRQPSGRISVSKVVFPPPGVPAAPVPAKPTPVATPTPAPPPPPQRRTAPTPQPSAAPELGGDELLRAFLDGAGIENLPPNTDAATALRTLGASTRAIVSTLARLLEARRLLKGEFRISQTVVAARENNPLKFSADESEMLLVMLGSVRPGFQSGQAAVWDAGKDLEAHQLALLAAFRAVLDAVLARLSPEAIAGAGGEEAGMFGRLLQAREAGYWQRYTKAYGEVKQDIGNTLAGRIGQIFAEAYERENSKKGGSR